MDTAVGGALFDVIKAIVYMIQLLIIAAVVISWVGADPNNMIVSFIRGATEPIFRPLRKLTSKIPGPLDWAPLVALMLIFFIDRIVSRLASGG